MATLVSPGLSVSVTEESAYASPGTGTIPLIVLATAQDKLDPTGTEIDGIAKYTKRINANLVVPVTSQREITQFFGNASFALTQGAETSEYGLLAAYSYLGQGAQAYVCRAAINLTELVSVPVAPKGPAPAATYWIDTNASRYGVHEWNGTTWINTAVSVEVNLGVTSAQLADPTTYSASTTAVNNTYLVTILSDGSTSVEVAYWRGEAGSWAQLNATWATAQTQVVTFSEHYNAPASPNAGDVWIKTTQPGSGLNLAIYKSDAVSMFSLQTVEAVNTDPAGSTYVAQDGSSTANITATLTNTNIVITLNAVTEGGFAIQSVVSGSPAEIASVIFAQDAEPTGTPAAGALWFSNAVDLDILVRSTTAWARTLAADIQFGTTMPTTDKAGGTLGAADIWIDTAAPEREFPKVYKHNGTSWLLYDNTDQTTSRGVLFNDFTDQSRTSLASGAITAIAGSPSYQLYPEGMLAVNMGQSANTVRTYNATVNAWRNHVTNNADGSGSFGRLAQHKAIAVSMQAAVTGNQDLRDPNRNFTIIAAPNFPELTDELVTLNTDRGETAFIIIDAPMRKTPAEATSWILGVGAAENGNDGLVTKNTYSAVYYPSGRATSPTGATVTVPASHMALYTFAYSDNVSYPWFAPAGLTRGVVRNGSAVGYITTENEFKAISLNQGQRDAMYINKLNPIANFPREGVVIFGQKSLHNITSALDRVNVARLVAYLNERFDQIGRPLIFQPNDKITRDRAKSIYERFLSDILSKRGITDFVVVCDSSNNTPARINRSELYIDVAVAPTKTAEFIYIPIRLVGSGTLH